MFKDKISRFKANLKNLNLIVGATGSGKSTLFNYLNDVPLKVSKRIVKGSKG